MRVRVPSCVYVCMCGECVCVGVRVCKGRGGRGGGDGARACNCYFFGVYVSMCGCVRAHVRVCMCK